MSLLTWRSARIDDHHEVSLAMAFGAQRWSEALTIALDEWRRLRSPRLATLIDLVGRRCPLQASQDDLQSWWIAHAVPYDAAAVSTLVEHVTVGVRASNGSWAAMRERWPTSQLVRALDGDPGLPQHRNWLERVLAMISWPHDPRVSSILADWLTHHEPLVRSPAFDVVYGAIADTLVALQDVRVIPQLEVFLADRDRGFRGQRAMVERVRVASSAHCEFANDPAITSLVDQLAVCDRDLAKLWHAVAEQPADLDRRAVLGDALLAAGDARGELITLQLAIEREPADGTLPRTRRVARLVDAWRYHWLGSALAALLVRDGTEFRHGMLEVVRLGYPNTPLRAWEAARGHRELATVHTALIGRVPAIEYARLVGSLPHLSTLEVDAPATLVELAQRGKKLSIDTLIYAQSNHIERPVPSALETFRTFAPVAPRIRRVVLVPTPLGDELAGLVSELPSLFPQLTTIELPASSRVMSRELTARFADVPLVEVRGSGPPRSRRDRSAART